MDKFLRPVLIGGTGRSGTSILKKVLLQHSSMTGANPELRIVIDPDGVLDFIDSLSQKWTPQQGDIAIQKFIKIYKNAGPHVPFNLYLLKFFTVLKITPPKYFGLCLDRYFGKNQLTNKLNSLLSDELGVSTNSGKWIGTPSLTINPKIFEVCPRDKIELYQIFRDYINTMYMNASHGTGATIWLDDTPYNILRANELYELFPNMFLIHIYREPRDVTASYLTKNWGGEDVETTAIKVKAIMNKWNSIKRSLPNSNYHEIFLDNLVKDPERELKNILDKLGLSLEQSMLDIKLNKANIGQWKTKFTSRQQVILDKIFD